VLKIRGQTWLVGEAIIYEIIAPAQAPPTKPAVFDLMEM